MEPFIFILEAVLRCEIPRSPYYLDMKDLFEFGTNRVRFENMFVFVYLESNGIVG